MPMRCFTVTGTATASTIAFTQSATSCGSAIRQAPNAPRCPSLRNMQTFHLQPTMVSFGGVFYPTGYMFLMFPGADDARAAADRLVRDGYDEESITLLTPALIQEQLARVDGHARTLKP